MKWFQPSCFRIFIARFLGSISGTCSLERTVSTARGRLSRNGFYRRTILEIQRWCLSKNGCSIPFLLIEVYRWLRWLASILMLLSLLIGFSIKATEDEHIDYFVMKYLAEHEQIHGDVSRACVF